MNSLTIADVLDDIRKEHLSNGKVRCYLWMYDSYIREAVKHGHDLPGILNRQLVCWPLPALMYQIDRQTNLFKTCSPFPEAGALHSC